MATPYQHKYFRPRTYWTVAGINILLFVVSFPIPALLPIVGVFSLFNLGMMVLNMYEPDPVD